MISGVYWVLGTGLESGSFAQTAEAQLITADDYDDGPGTHQNLVFFIEEDANTFRRGCERFQNLQKKMRTVF